MFDSRRLWDWHKSCLALVTSLNIQLSRSLAELACLNFSEKDFKLWLSLSFLPFPRVRNWGSRGWWVSSPPTPAPAKVAAGTIPGDHCSWTLWYPPLPHSLMDNCKLLTLSGTQSRTSPQQSLCYRGDILQNRAPRLWRRMKQLSLTTHTHASPDLHRVHMAVPHDCGWWLPACQQSNNSPPPLQICHVMLCCYMCLCCRFIFSLCILFE